MVQRRLSQLDSTWPAALPRRLGAMIYDGFLVAAIWIGIAIAHVAFFRFVVGQPADEIGVGSLEVWSLRLLLVISAMVFFTFSWTRGGMTLGMQTWRLRVQTVDGYTITPLQSVVRCLIAWVSLAAFGLGYWWVLFDSERRSWPDIVSNTRTVVLPKR
ncbi:MULTISPECIES: RDD family protein [Vreelandella]|uniref:RDD family protein n=2 Tax=Vreelandella TaxID=3137766 RepID=A0A7C9K615_9GAMM|nr:MULTISPECIES: RDD family protein [Halomonas]NDL71242.1 RDD family protein [Halomonas alkaliphila]NYS46247.1 RDD family protein [Halomonas zhaodongensis]